MLGQPISMLLPEVVGFSCTASCKEGTTATDLVLTVTQMLRKKGVVGRFVEFYGPGVDDTGARRPRDDRQHGAGIRRDLRLLPGRQRDAALSGPHRPRSGAGRAGRGLCQGARPVARREHARPGLHRHARARSRHRRAVARRAAPAAGPRALSGAGQEFRGRAAQARREPTSRTKAGEVRSKAPITSSRTAMSSSPRSPAAPTPRTRASCSPPGCSRATPSKRGLKVKPWVKTSLAPGSQVVTDYYAAAGLAGRSRRARLQPRRLWLHDLHRQFRAAARADRRGGRGGRSRGRRRAVGQPQFRRPHQSLGARELSRLAAAGRRLCARRHDENDLTNDPLGEDPRRQAGLSARTSGRPTEEVADTVRQRGDARHVPQAVRQRLRGPEEWQQDHRAPSGMTFAWDPGSTYVAQAALLRRHAEGAGAVADITARARWRSSATPSPPTTSRRPARIKQDSPAGAYLMEHRCGRPTSTPTARAAATIKVMMRGTFANIRIRNEMVPGIEGGVTKHHARRRGDADLRRGDEVQGGRHAAGDRRRQGIRHRLVARLGGEGHQACSASAR